jgi:hypothetical protein
VRADHEEMQMNENGRGEAGGNNAQRRASARARKRDIARQRQAKRNARRRAKRAAERSGDAAGGAAGEAARYRRALRASIDYRGTPGRMPQTAEEVDIMRLALVRRMRAFMGTYRHCPVPACRRRGDCVGLTMRCRRDDPPATPEGQTEAMAFFRKALDKIADERGWR